MTRNGYKGAAKSRLAANRRKPHRPNRRRQRRGANGRSGGLPLALVFTVLIGINIYVFFFRGGTSIQDLMKASAIQNKPSTGERQSAKPRPSATPAPHPLPEGPQVVHGSMRGHLGLLAALTTFGVEEAEAAALIAALRPLMNMRTLKPNQQFDIAFVSQTRRVSRFTYHLSSSVRVVAERQAAGGFGARRDP